MLASNELREGLNSFSLRQGYEMGRPSDISLEVDVAAGRLAAVRIAGSSVKISEGLISSVTIITIDVIIALHY
ncbi:MAG: hypothetical protein R3D29_05640 [Nitratireductor sp.]